MAAGKAAKGEWKPHAKQNRYPETKTEAETETEKEKEGEGEEEIKLPAHAHKIERRNMHFSSSWNDYAANTVWNRNVKTKDQNKLRISIRKKVLVYKVREELSAKLKKTLYKWNINLKKEEKVYKIVYILYVTHIYLNSVSTALVPLL